MLADLGSELGTFEKEGHIAMITALTQIAPLYCDEILVNGILTNQ